VQKKHYARKKPKKSGNEEEGEGERKEERIHMWQSPLSRDTNNMTDLSEALSKETAIETNQG